VAGAGTASTGSGGGGGYEFAVGANGGSGIIIARYRIIQPQIFAVPSLSVVGNSFQFGS